MGGDLPPGYDDWSTTRPLGGHWTTSSYRTAGVPPRRWQVLAVVALTVALVAASIAGVALGVALDRARSVSSAASMKPTHTNAETTAAQEQLCDTYRLAARAVQIETNGNNSALGRIAAVNAAAMLEDAASNPALDAKHRDAAHTLATAYRTTTAMATNGVVSDTEWRAALADVNAKDAEMKKVCGGG